MGQGQNISWGIIQVSFKIVVAIILVMSFDFFYSFNLKILLKISSELMESMLKAHENGIKVQDRIGIVVYVEKEGDHDHIVKKYKFTYLDIANCILSKLSVLISF